MSQTSTAYIVPAEAEAGVGTQERIATLLHAGILGALLLLIPITAIPYGTADAWWKAAFVSVVFVVAIGWVVEGLLSGSWRTGGRAVLAPVVALAVFSLLQTISLGAGNAAGVSLPFWNSISADPFATRFFTLQLVALIVAGALFYRYTATETRVNAVIHVIIAVAVASALFGILRQTTQHDVGFGLPFIRPEQGYAQFVNKNHFAFLMEMGFGLALGRILAGGVTRELGLIYATALIPIWVALVLSNSRGGILAMLVQLVVAVLLFTSTATHSTTADVRWMKLARSLPVRMGLVSVLVIGMFVGILWVGGDRLASNIEAARNEFESSVLAKREGASRNEIWMTTLRIFQDHPIAGVGMSGYWIAITAYHDASGALTPQEAHNEYLELLSSGGVIGFALGIWFALVVLKRVRRNFRSSSKQQRALTFAATLAIAGVAVHSFFDFGLHMLGNALVFVAVVTIATREKD